MGERSAIFRRSLEIAKAHGIYGIHGRSALNLGLLHKKKKRYQAAKEYFVEAIAELEKTDLSDDLARARLEFSRLSG
jgi:tetratricopeptide (TPR) repeat protein